MAKKASAAQARFLAEKWSLDRTVLVEVCGYKNPTVRACIKAGWLVPTEHWEGSRYRPYGVTHSGLQALGAYLLALQAQEAS